MKEYWIDESDQFYPQIKHVSRCSRPEFVDLMTFTEAKQELIRGAQNRIDFWRGQIAEWRTMRKSDIPTDQLASVMPDTYTFRRNGDLSLERSLFQRMVHVHSEPKGK